MIFEPGFLGTKALMYMDIVTLYFALLPFLLALSIHQAVKGRYALHMRSQIVILTITIVMVLLFETGVRVSGGFAFYAPQSSWSYDFLLGFLAVHVLIALLAVGGWIYLVITSYIAYKNDTFTNSAIHRKIGKWIFSALTLTSVMGCSIYYFLFL